MITKNNYSEPNYNEELRCLELVVEQHRQLRLIQTFANWNTIFRSLFRDSNIFTVPPIKFQLDRVDCSFFNE